MYKLLVISFLVVCCTAYGSGGSGRPTLSGGYGSSSSSTGQVIRAAVQSRQSVEYREVPTTTSNLNPATIEVRASARPVSLVFRSTSSSLNIQQKHYGAQGSTQETSSEDEPHVLKHSVKKPIIQKVREVIAPFRKVTQEIQPVQEEVLTLVARDKEQPTTSTILPSTSAGQVSSLSPDRLSTSSPSASKQAFGSLSTTKSGY